MKTWLSFGVTMIGLAACSAESDSEPAELSGVAGSATFAALTTTQAETLCQWRFAQSYHPSLTETCTQSAVLQFDAEAPCQESVRNCVQTSEPQNEPPAALACNNRMVMMALASCPDVTVATYEHCVLAREQNRRESARRATCDDISRSLVPPDARREAEACRGVSTVCTPGF